MIPESWDDLGPFRLAAWFLIGSTFIALVVVAGFIGYRMFAPCNWRMPALTQQAASVVAAVEAHRSRTGSLPPRRADGMPDAVGVPADYAGEFVAGRDSSYTLTYAGTLAPGEMGFDGPWVRYTSVTDRMECFAR